MKVRQKLTMLFTMLFGLLLLVFALAIYFSYSINRKDEYYKRLKQQAVTKANLLFNVKIHPNVLQEIHKNSPNALYQEEIAIYDTAFHLLYHDDVEEDKVKETAQMMGAVLHQGEIEFSKGKLQAVGVLYVKGGTRYVITAAAQDEPGLAKLQTLKYILIVSFVFAIVLTLVAGRFFSKKALEPVSEMVDEVKEITATNLDLRVFEGNGKDEIAELAVTFNQMLDRLEHSFDAQKQFVSNISHELRTPLSAMITELELAGTKSRTTEEYRRTIQLALSDARRLVKLSNGLLDLAKASYDQAEITFRELRLDELLVDARQQVLKIDPGFHINITFEQEIEDDHLVSIIGNEYLLKIAFANLLENGCKFSDNKQCTVAISFNATSTILRFTDQGIGIRKEDLPHLFTSFYRGSNQQYAAGNGIGLSLSHKIISLHNGHIAVDTLPGTGTTFIITLPHLPVSTDA
jgi:signal transduction histidine kinase